MQNLRAIIPDTDEAVIDRLNELLATALFFEDLYKRYHWLVTGPHFLPLHTLFDDYMETLENEIDDLGERIRVLDGDPIWNPAVFANEKLLPAPDESIIDDLLIAHEAFQMEAAYADELRKAANEFEDDLATQDLIVEYLRIHEKQAWFLREFIRKVNIDDYDEEVFETNGSTS
jgi:starvation-inducible DNA-binding protein